MSEESKQAKEAEESRPVSWTLRCPPELFRWMRAAAKREHRSANGYVVALIEEAQKREERRGRDKP